MFDQLMDFLANCDGDVCVSGGAAGSDREWVRIATEHGQDAVHFTFKGHSYKGHSPIHRVDVPEDYLELAIPKLRVANQTLRRKIPSPGYVRNLLCRNMYQVKNSMSVYAVANITYGQVEGGTAWATQMFIDQNLRGGHVYVLDKKTLKWHEWKHQEFTPIDKPPQPSGVWAGIGSREITPQIIRMMEELWQCQTDTTSDI